MQTRVSELADPVPRLWPRVTPLAISPDHCCKPKRENAPQTCSLVIADHKLKSWLLFRRHIQATAPARYSAPPSACLDACLDGLTASAFVLLQVSHITPCY